MSARGFHLSTVTRPRLSAAGATGRLISPPAVGGSQGFCTQADCYIPVCRGADLSLPLRKTHQLTMRHLQVSSAAHAGCRESYLVQVASAFLSSQHHQARKFTHKVRIRLKQNRLFGCKSPDWWSFCARVKQQVSLCMQGCSRRRAAGASSFTLWNRYGWAAFLRPNPKSAVDGQTTQLSALIGRTVGLLTARAASLSGPFGEEMYQPSVCQILCQSLPHNQRPGCRNNATALMETTGAHTALQARCLFQFSQSFVMTATPHHPTPPP